LTAKSEIEKDGIDSVIIVTGEKDLGHFGKGNFQLDPFASFPFWNFKVELVCFNPDPALPS